MKNDRQAHLAMVASVDNLPTRLFRATLARGRQRAIVLTIKARTIREATREAMAMLSDGESVTVESA